MNILKNLEILEHEYNLTCFEEDYNKISQGESYIPQLQHNQLNQMGAQSRINHEKVPELLLVLPKWIEISDDILRYFQKIIKQVSRDKQRIALFLQNNQNDEAGIGGDELSYLLQGISDRFNKLKSLSINIDHWGLLFMVIPNIESVLIQIGRQNLLELSIISSNRSLNPSVTNKTVKSLGCILQNMQNLTLLELDLDDPSSERKKQINEDGFVGFCEGLEKLTHLRTLKLKLACWFSFFRQNIKDPSNSIKKFCLALSNKKYLKHLSLNLKWWEDIEFKHLAMICNSLSASCAHQLSTCELNFQRWSYFNQQNQDQTVHALSEFLSNLKSCKSLNVSFFNLGTGFQDQRNIKHQVSAAGVNSHNDSDQYKVNPDLLQLFMKQISKIAHLQQLEIQVHEYVSWSGMKILRNSIFDLKLLTKLIISSHSEKYETIKYLSTLIRLPKVRRNIIYFLQTYKKSPYYTQFRKDLPCHIAESLFDNSL
ncbi:hypothetical protein ABPG72_022261 [Tetrahymena utriculariae]